MFTRAHLFLTVIFEAETAKRRVSFASRSNLTFNLTGRSHYKVLRLIVLSVQLKPCEQFGIS